MVREVGEEPFCCPSLRKDEVEDRNIRCVEHARDNALHQILAKFYAKTSGGILNLLAILAIGVKEGGEVSAYLVAFRDDLLLGFTQTKGETGVQSGHAAT